MNEPLFLTLDDVLQFHADQIELAGGDGAILGKIESAIAQPNATWDRQFLHEDLAAMAAAYLFHIVQNHGFATAINGRVQTPRSSFSNSMDIHSIGP